MRDDSNEVDAEGKPPGTTQAGATPAGSASPSRHHFASEALRTLASLIVGLAWPVATLIILHYLGQHVSTVVDGIQELMKGNKQVEVSADVAHGLRLIIVAQEVQRGLTQQVSTAKQENKENLAKQVVISDNITGIDQVVAKATYQLSSILSHPNRAIKVLWVDDHPQNNLGLAYAFQTLGIIVVCVDSNDGIDDAFSTAGTFDVVITDMYRDAIGDSRHPQPEGGLETIKIIKQRHKSVPVVIYASSYASHANDELQAPVIAITDDPRVLFARVTEIASKKQVD